MTAGLGMSFPCCIAGNIDPIEAALLRQFIRYGVAPVPRACYMREAQYMRDLHRLEVGALRRRGTSGALTESQIAAEKKRVQTAFEIDIEAMRSDPRYYCYWQPTCEDWRRLAILQAASERNGKDIEAALLPPLKQAKKRGRPKADMWTRARFVYAARAQLIEQIAKRDEIDPKKVTVTNSDVAQAASKLIAAAAKKGHWDGPTLTPGTIEAAWSELHIDDENQAPEYPERMRRALDWNNHVKDIESKADRLGIAANLPNRLNENLGLPAEFSVFARWAAERVNDADRLPSGLRDWGDYRQHLRKAYEFKVLKKQNPGISEQDALRERARVNSLYAELLYEFYVYTN